MVSLYDDILSFYEAKKGEKMNPKHEASFRVITVPLYIMLSDQNNCLK